MKNDKNLNLFINNDNDTTNKNEEKVINKHNIKPNPIKKIIKRSNLPLKNFKPSSTKNNSIKEININPNLNNIITEDNNDDDIMPRIIGGNDNNSTEQNNDLIRMKAEEISIINKDRHADLSKEDKKINKVLVKKNNHRLTNNCKSTMEIGFSDNKKINNLKQNQIKAEIPNNKNKTLRQNQIQLENQTIDDMIKIPHFKKSNENLKRKDVISPYYQNLYRRYKRSLGDINVTNSILIMLINILDVNIHLNKDKRKIQILFLEKSLGCSLASILYYLNQYINNNENIDSKNIFNKYKEFTNLFISLNYGHNDKSLFDINNIEYILEFMYIKINFEFTFANKNLYNNNINNNYNTNNNNNFFYQFQSSNKSLISDMFTGFYQYNNNSLNSQRNLYNGQNYNFKFFSFIKFNLKKINQYYDSININEMNLNQFYNNINLYNCFDYTFKDNNHSIYSFPKILTIVLSHTDNCNFILNHEINLASYTNNFQKNNSSSYLLTSIFCQMSYNKNFINYIFDSQDGSWFSLSDQEMRKVDSIDINAIPLILIYQMKNTLQQEYHEIKIKNKLYTTINFQSGLTTQLFFDEKDKIRDVRNKIKSWFDKKEPFTLLINGSIAQNDESLSKLLEKGYNILVMPKSN